MIMGFFLVRPIPLPVQEGYDLVDDEEVAARAVEEDDPDMLDEVLQRHSRSHTHLLDHDFVDGPHPHYVRRGRVEEAVQSDVGGEDVSEDATVTSPRVRSLSRGAALVFDALPNLHGKKLFKSADFWLLFSILSIRGFLFISFLHIFLTWRPFSLVSGTGLMCSSSDLSTCFSG